jgi:hypothetical protein
MVTRSVIFYLQTILYIWSLIYVSKNVKYLTTKTSLIIVIQSKTRKNFHATVMYRAVSASPDFALDLLLMCLETRKHVVEMSFSDTRIISNFVWTGLGFQIWNERNRNTLIHRSLISWAPFIYTYICICVCVCIYIYKRLEKGRWKYEFCSKRNIA